MRTENLHLYQLNKQERMLKRDKTAHYILYCIARLGVAAGFIIMAGATDEINQLTDLQFMLLATTGLALFVFGIFSTQYTAHLFGRTKRRLTAIRRTIDEKKAKTT